VRWSLLLALLLAACTSRAPVLPPALEQRPGPSSVELAEVAFFPQQDYQCGPAALAAVLRYAGAEVDAEALRPRVYLPERKGSLAIEMAAAARSFGRIAYQPPPTLDALLAELQAGRPVVVLQNLGVQAYPVWHFAVVIGYDRGTDAFLLRSGRTRRLEVRGAELMRTWSLASQWALVILRPGELPASDDAHGYLRAVAATEASLPAPDAVRAYEAAATRWPDNAIARFGLANAARRAGDTQRAIGLYARLADEAPGEIAARNNLADTLNAVGCKALALRTIDAALAAASTEHPLYEVMLQTRAEILAHEAEAPGSAECARWEPGSPGAR
jgi:tetratricopeptide (TPR) repeat protein